MKCHLNLCFYEIYYFKNHVNLSELLKKHFEIDHITRNTNLKNVFSYTIFRMLLHSGKIYWNFIGKSISF